MNENEVVYEADEYDRASVEFLASEFILENRRQPTIEELNL